MMHPEEVQKILEKAFPGAWVSVEDMTGTKDHFDVVVTSSVFQGKTLLEQHRAVQAALAGEMDSRIHAVKIKTRVP
jgi:stress-induced morphogen